MSREFGPEAGGSMLEQFLRTEAARPRKIHEQLALAASERGSLPRSLTAAFALSFLYASETASARSLAEMDTDLNPDPTIYLIRDPERSIHFERTVDLEPYLLGPNGEPPQIDVSLWLIPRDGRASESSEGGVKISLSDPRLSDFIRNQGSLKFDGFIAGVEVRRDLSVLPDLSGGEWTVYQSGDGVVATKITKDFRNNELNIVGQLGDKAYENRLVVPPKLIGDSNVLRPLSGIPELSWIESLDLAPDRHLWREVGLSYYDLTRDDIDVVADIGVRNIRQGISQVVKTFGFTRTSEQSIVESVYFLSDSDSERVLPYDNLRHHTATATPTTGVIQLSTKILSLEGLSDERKGELLRNIAAHEALHLLDLRAIRLTDVPEMQKLWLSTSPEILAQINESNFYGIHELDAGHAQDNPHEFVASFLNSLLSERWEEGLERLSPDAQNVYKQALTILNQHLTQLASSDVQFSDQLKKAAIEKILRERTAFFKGHVNAY
jgi:hypothetical protein